MPLCTVIIPAYNSGAYVDGALSSALAQTFTDFEIIVVDDASPDGGLDAAKACAGGDPRAKFIRLERNLGVAGARNAGVDLAHTEWVALLDADDLWEPAKLERQFEAQAKTGADIICSGAVFMDKTGRPLGAPVEVPEEITFKTLLGGNPIICSSVLVRRALLLKAPFERDDLHEDYLTWLKLLKEGFTAAGVNEPLIRYRVSQGSKSGAKLKSAVMNWGTLKHFGIPFPARCASMARYAVHGLRRYAFRKWTLK